MGTIKIIRQIHSKSIRLNDLDKFIGKKVELTINEYEESQNNKPNESLRGVLKAYAKPELIDKEKDAWKDAVSENIN